MANITFRGADVNIIDDNNVPMIKFENKGGLAYGDTNTHFLYPYNTTHNLKPIVLGGYILTNTRVRFFFPMRTGHGNDIKFKNMTIQIYHETGQRLYKRSSTSTQTVSLINAHPITSETGEFNTTYLDASSSYIGRDAGGYQFDLVFKAPLLNSTTTTDTAQTYRAISVIVENLDLDRKNNIVTGIVIKDSETPKQFNIKDNVFIGDLEITGHGQEPYKGLWLKQNGKIEFLSDEKLYPLNNLKGETITLPRLHCQGTYNYCSIAGKTSCREIIFTYPLSTSNAGDIVLSDLGIIVYTHEGAFNGHLRNTSGSAGNVITSTAREYYDDDSSRLYYKPKTSSSYINDIVVLKEPAGLVIRVIFNENYRLLCNDTNHTVITDRTPVVVVARGTYRLE